MYIHIYMYTFVHMSRYVYICIYTAPECSFRMRSAMTGPMPKTPGNRWVRLPAMTWSSHIIISIYMSIIIIIIIIIIIVCMFVIIIIIISSSSNYSYP